MALAFINLITIAQTQKLSVTGKVTDAKTQTILGNATVMLNNKIMIADENGMFAFTKLSTGTYELKVSEIGYADDVQKVELTNHEIYLNVQLKSVELFLQPLEVKALRANAAAPFAKTNISKDEISKNNLGLDLPFILNETPSVYVSSDAGTGIGYTYLHIRGTDATRINVTLNGIPYNDAESMGTYFVDLPDFSSSVNSIQIQRGVGSSSNGTGAFGATINLLTNEFNAKPYAELNNSFGSFNTFKNTIKVGSGLLGRHFTIDARLSNITSNGYIDRATSSLQSFAFSIAYINKKSSLRFNIFSGKEKTYQAWYGVPQDSLTTNRTYNPAGTEKLGTPYNNQSDNYWQDHYQLFFNHFINQKWSFNTAAFITYGRGYYEEYKANQLFNDYGLPDVIVGSNSISSSDLIRQRWLSNYFYGQIASLQFKNKKNEITLGGGWTKYDGKHFGKIIWSQVGNISNYEYYRFPALKTDENIYAKWQHKLDNYFQTYLDVQYRHIYHNMNGFEGNKDLHIGRSFNFLNPKAGITYTNNELKIFLSYALGQKEPNRDDFQASILQQPSPETLHDFELGIEKKNSNYQLGATVYYMLYKDQLVLTGKINDVGSYTRTNVPNSYRLGIELQGGYVFLKWLNANANLSFSKNKIKYFTEFIDNWDNGNQDAVVHNNTDISFSPSVIGGTTINILPTKNIEFSLLSKYVGKQYLDNSQNENRILNSFFLQDVRLAYTIKNKVFKECRILAQVNNLFNKKYEPNGWTYAYISSNVLTNSNSYFPMAGTNILVGLNIKL